jgi:hypothetical protein
MGLNMSSRDQGSPLLRMGIWLVALVSITLLSGACTDDDSQQSTQITTRNPNGINAQIEARIREWTALHEVAAEPSIGLEGFLIAREDAGLKQGDGTQETGEALLARIADVHDRFTKIEISLGPIEVTEEGPALYRARFHLDRRAWDAEGLLHIQATHHQWLVEVDEASNPWLVETEEQIVVPHPSTGTKVLCL